MGEAERRRAAKPRPGRWIPVAGTALAMLVAFASIAGVAEHLDRYGRNRDQPIRGTGTAAVTTCTEHAIGARFRCAATVDWARWAPSSSAPCVFGAGSREVPGRPTTRRT